MQFLDLSVTWRRLDGLSVLALDADVTASAETKQQHAQPVEGVDAAVYENEGDVDADEPIGRLRRLVAVVQYRVDEWLAIDVSAAGCPVDDGEQDVDRGEGYDVQEMQYSDRDGGDEDIDDDVAAVDDVSADVDQVQSSTCGKTTHEIKMAILPAINSLKR